MSKSFLKNIENINCSDTIKYNIPCLDDEVWVKINKSAFPLLKPVYYVSNKARIYNSETRHLLKTRCLSSKYDSPYYKVNLQIIINDHSYGSVFLVHRLMMCSFCPIENMDKMLVNHKDGNKFNDDLSNLEWSTPSENTLHAYKTGLFKPAHGENHICATITNQDAIQIRDLLLSRKYTQLEIAEIVGTTESIVHSIATRRSWKEITDGYDLSILEYRIPKVFTFDEIEQCCQFFEENKKPQNTSVRRFCIMALKYINYNKEITEGTINSIRALYKKERYTHISKNYLF